MTLSPLMFFFSSRRRHTRYWRDWSSDVCSSDLSRQSARGVHAHFYHQRTPRADWRERNESRLTAGARIGISVHVASILGSFGLTSRSEERRVGKEGRSRGSPYH